MVLLGSLHELSQCMHDISQFRTSESKINYLTNQTAITIKKGKYWTNNLRKKMIRLHRSRCGFGVVETYLRVDKGRYRWDFVLPQEILQNSQIFHMEREWGKRIPIN